MKGKTVAVLGGGRVAERRVRKLVSHGARVVAVAREFTPFFSDKSRTKNLSLIRLNLNRDTKKIEFLLQKSALAFVTTNDHELNRKLARLAKHARVPVNVSDDSKNSDFFVPAITSLGGIELAISTGGKSPIVAQALRRRIERMISVVDLEQIELQGYARLVVKRHIRDVKERKKFLHRLLKDIQIKNLLETGQISEAKRLVYRLARSWSHNLKSEI